MYNTSQYTQNVKEADGTVLSENTKQMEKMEGKAGCEKGQRNFTIKVEKTWDVEEKKSEEMSQ